MPAILVPVSSLKAVGATKERADVAALGYIFYQTEKPPIVVHKLECTFYSAVSQAQLGIITHILMADLDKAFTLDQPHEAI